ncbi:uncharacterized protein LOC127750908 [Frankliniella occidentalis]|uniref:Uncharacterized protein LOC127750908 n=1 Tax=Frankliniella occidentalis TaxID=133901 RepID=A0A9C6X5P8_FRAOC|nr:uncharacterized protein LOC127750908 [Frankliniella occidentalis]
MADFMDFDECLTDNIQKILPHLSASDASDVSRFLQNKGVRKLVDLRRITVNILNEKLNFIESSDLYDAWQSAYGTSQSSNNEQPTSSAAQPSNSSRIPLRTLQENARETISQSRIPVFDENSPYFPSGVRAAIKANKRPSPDDRQLMVENVVDYCKEKIPNFYRTDLAVVAKQIVKDYEKSFKDTIVVSDHGSDSLYKQFISRLDNQDRKNKRKAKAADKEASGSKEAYGCVLWDPPLPPSETEESLEIIRLDLEKMSRISKKDWDWRIIKKKLTDSYYLQRKHINVTIAPAPQQKKGTKRKRATVEEEEEESTDDPVVSVPVIKSKWPLLFSAQGMNIHFKILTNVDLKGKISAYVASESKRLIEFLSTKNDSLAKLKRNMARAEEQGLGSTKLVATINMLICYFKEDMEYFVRFTEKTSTYEEVKEFHDLPAEKTPILVAAGDSLYNFEKLFVFIDNILVSVVKNILDGLVLLFSAHFIFNIYYSEKVACFLTFIQKAIAGISPTRGSKSLNAALTRRANEKTVKIQNSMELVKQQELEEKNAPL